MDRTKDEPGENGVKQWAQAAVEQHQAPLLRYVLSLTGELDVSRDVVQDTFARLCEQNPSELDGHLLPWLFRVARNRAMDWHRKERRMHALDIADLGSRAAPGDSPAIETERRDSTEAVMRLLAGLPSEQQEVVRLKFQNQLSYKEIAEITSRSTGTVGFLLHTALATLRMRMAALNEAGSARHPSA